MQRETSAALQLKSNQNVEQIKMAALGEFEQWKIFQY